MNYANKLMIPIRIKLLMAVFVGIGGLIAMQGIAHAAAPVPNNFLPRSQDFSQGNGVWLTVAKYDGTNFLLDAQNSTVRIYSNTANPVLTITNGGHCPAGGIDAGATEAEATTEFRIYQLNPDPPRASDKLSAPFARFSPQILRTYLSSDLSCGAENIPITGNGGLAWQTNEPGWQNGKFAFEVEAIWSEGAGGWNMFKYQVNSGRLSYYAGSGDKFAVKDQDRGSPPGGSYGDFSFGFAPNCNLKVGDPDISVPIKWFDADAGQSNQPQNPIQTVLVEYNQAGTITSTRSINITTGDNVSGSVNVTIKPRHKYEWRWFRIHSSNGVQFQLPSDSYNTLIDFNNDCPSGPTPGPNATCTATPSTSSPAVGQTITMKVRVRNISGAGGPTFNSNYEVRQISPGGQVRNLSGNLPPVPPNNVDNNIPVFNINARASPQTVTFVYQLFNGSGTAIGSTCQRDVVWRNCPAGGCAGGGQISADCGTTTVFGVNSPATWRPTPASYTGPRPAPGTVPPRQATPVKIGIVPVAIRITEMGNPGNTFTKIIDGGVGNDGGSTAPMSTYDLWSGMWLHKSYTLELFVQGATGGDSTRYNNDGFWNPTNNANDGGFYYGIGPSPTDTATVGGCMNARCGTAGSADVEPGQTTTLRYGVLVTNSTQRTNYSSNNGGGYYFVPGAGPGIANVGSVSTSPATFEPGEDRNVNVTFPARIDYGDGSSTGQFWVTMYFQGNPISLPDLQSPCPPGEVTPGTRPYFEVRAGDIATGGGFTDAFDVCPTTAPGYISPATGYNATSTRYDQAGGIRAYGNPSGARGSEAEFGVLSLGLVIGNVNGPVGFFSGRNAMFANSGVPDSPSSSPPGASNLGGYLSPNGATQAHCVNDFYTKTRIAGTAPDTLLGNNLSVTGLPTKQYVHTGDLTLNASNIATGQRVTLYVDGNVTINGNITYASSYDPTDRGSVPYFSLIVKGDITLTSGVSQLDGLYVSQPKTDVDGGTFKTCADNDFCAGQLIVNGAVIAQSVQLTRAHGTMGPLNADINNVTQNPAEIFNYAPSLLIGLPNFNPLNNGTEALFNLPPVF